MAETSMPLPRGAMRPGKSDGPVGVHVAEVAGGAAIVRIMGRRGKDAALRAAIAERYGLELPDGARRIGDDALAVLGIAPQQWLALSRSGAVTAPQMATALAGLASVADHSDGTVALEVSGSRVREALAKGVMLDLHERGFAVGDTAATLVAQIPVQISRPTSAAAFEMLVPRSYRKSFLIWLENSAAEFGISQLLSEIGINQKTPIGNSIDL